ncbi:4-hydroxybenzoate octaprenyltransferase [Marinospirillum alkaliphilum]|uniref:4-hydroxybenzoate octaprenyltransferase n=1 Tax=Marinospirillum alkaliphilum DSM 21637 TaxID=1122209 RepID=A0A1K1WKI2_9GAMM|nr:4-hydroxybenzoate octaprenyltransferase [Marinospirillum alkaliphilum]SFX37912.1 4-hydroxybenzoate polyprenyltransferase [Marinospirillum alkaliphilum DSM 21637]
MTPAPHLTPSNSSWHQRLPAFVNLTRLNRPIGTWLVMWPTLWALWFAAGGFPDLKVLLIFVLGVVLMRSAGCVINDYADRNFDGHVQRTQQRPLATGQVSTREALTLFVILCLLAFVLVLFTNTLTILLAPVALLLAACYPFMKRYTHFPQVVLGAAFSWAIPMAFAAQTGSLHWGLWLVFLANLMWTVAYDTAYAMEDREDDLKIGVKSTAVYFGQYDRLAIGILQAFTLLLLLAAGVAFERGAVFMVAGVGGMALLFIWQQWLIRDRQRGPCLRAFLNNHYAGMLVFAALFIDYLLY